MGKYYDEIPDSMITWIKKQEMFFVATAPLRADGHVNVSPKGIRDSFHVESNTRVWYEDLSGSGTFSSSFPYELLVSSCRTPRQHLILDV